MDRDWLCEIAAASCKWCMKWEILPSAQRIWMCYVTRRALHRYTRFISVRAAAGKASKAQRPALTWCKSPVKLMANSPDSKRRQRTEMCKVSRRWGGAEESNGKSRSVSSSVRIIPYHYRDNAQEGLSSSTAKAALLSAWKKQIWVAALLRQEGSTHPKRLSHTTPNRHALTHTYAGKRIMHIYINKSLFLYAQTHTYIYS